MKPLVAIRCLVFNHEPYLRDCLEGFVMQKTNFTFCVIAHDDCSTDGSAAIIREYEKKYPEIFRPIYETENQYSKHDGALARVMKEAVDATGARYIAICEGDDYWTDPLKLQKQVDFMETHLDYTMCCHGVDWYQDGKFFKRNEISPTDVDLRVEDIISKGGFYINVCSILYRIEYSQSQTRYQQIASYGDHPLYVKLALAGKVRYLHNVMGVYRWMNNNSWTNRNYHDSQKFAIHLYNTKEWLLALNDETDGKYKATISSFIAPLISSAYLHGAYPNEWKYLKDAKIVGGKSIIRACKDILIKHLPKTYALFIKITGKENKK